MSTNTDEEFEVYLGRLKHTTPETCESCNRGKLQLRVRNEDGRDYEYLYCPHCQFEKRPKRSKAEGRWKKERDIFPDEVFDVKEVKLKNVSDKRRK
jgi:ssDNA-binding Zn-finger/Zn-ribbon topoisomerase 1